MRPFDLESCSASGSRCWAPTAPASRTSCGCSRPAADPTSSTARWTTSRSSRSPTRVGRSARGCGRAGSRRPTTTRSWPAGRCWRSCTAATSTARARPASRQPALDRYELAGAGRAALRDAVRRAAGAAPDPAAGAVRRDAAAARRADRQPRPGLRRGAGGGPGGLRGHGGRRHPRPLVRPRLSTGSWSSVRRRRGRVRRAGLGRAAGGPATLSRSQERDESSCSAVFPLQGARA